MLSFLLESILAQVGNVQYTVRILIVVTKEKKSFCVS